MIKSLYFRIFVLTILLFFSSPSSQKRSYHMASPFVIIFFHFFLLVELRAPFPQLDFVHSFIRYGHLLGQQLLAYTLDFTIDQR